MNITENVLLVELEYGNYVEYVLIVNIWSGGGYSWNADILKTGDIECNETSDKRNN